MSSACKRVAWCVLQVGHVGACSPLFSGASKRLDELVAKYDAIALGLLVVEREDLLHRVEAALTNSPKFNPWDLGPSDLLLEVRAAIGKK